MPQVLYLADPSQARPPAERGPQQPTPGSVKGCGGRQTLTLPGVVNASRACAPTFSPAAEVVPGRASETGPGRASAPALVRVIDTGLAPGRASEAALAMRPAFVPAPGFVRASGSGRSPIAAHRPPEWESGACAWFRSWAASATRCRSHR